MLTLQDKLALMLTSAGSQRVLARSIGISHQKVGRWLREGLPATIDPTTGYLIHSAGIRQIPKAFSDVIQAAFNHHITVSRLQAQFDNIPFNSKIPTFDYRGQLRKVDRDGNQIKGDRVFTSDTQFISPELRDKIFDFRQASGKYLAASIRSVVWNTWESGATGVNYRLTDRHYLKYAYTATENIQSNRRTSAIKSINKQLKSHYEPHAVIIGDEFVSQLMLVRRKHKG